MADQGESDLIPVETRRHMEQTLRDNERARMGSRPYADTADVDPEEAF